jgi:asparagine synthase (glutamine-hydrolysing)
MCGIVGIIDLSGQGRPIPTRALQAMAGAIVHRGPDEEGYLTLPGVGLGSRRLSIVGLEDGRQPIANERGDVAVVFNGELFDYPEMRANLQARGHCFRTHCDTEILPHCWEDHQEKMFPSLRGQFSFALHDRSQRRLILARDRFGICPLFWTECWGNKNRNTPGSGSYEQTEGGGGDWLLFASEIKALIASGMMEVRPDPRGIHHLFTFMAMPGPVTCFAGVNLLMPGHFLDVRLPPGRPARLDDRTYWEIDYPDQGEEDYRSAPDALVLELEEKLLRSVTRRLRADVPVVSYISGGVDSSVVVALASQVRGSPIPSFTIGIQEPRLDETSDALLTAQHVESRFGRGRGSPPNKVTSWSSGGGSGNVTVVRCGQREIFETYPELTRAAEVPVIDTSCAALLHLAREVHRQGYKVALTGEGADEWLAGYPWHKFHRALSVLDRLPGIRLSSWVRRGLMRFAGAPGNYWASLHSTQELVGGHNGWLDFYALLGIARERLLAQPFREALGDHSPWDDLRLNRERLLRWHPLHRELYLSARILLPGLLLASKGDRVAMHSSVETRYPFLDEEVFDFLARVPPKWKLRGLRDKILLRRMAERWIPTSIARRRKVIFRAPFDSFHLEVPQETENREKDSFAPTWVEQLLSEESLRRTGYFDSKAVHQERRRLARVSSFGLRRLSSEMGLVGVLATQLWHHTFIEGTLADLPSSVSKKSVERGPWTVDGEESPGFDPRPRAPRPTVHAL